MLLCLYPKTRRSTNGSVLCVAGAPPCEDVSGSPFVSRRARVPLLAECSLLKELLYLISKELLYLDRSDSKIPPQSLCIIDLGSWIFRFLYPNSHDSGDHFLTKSLEFLFESFDSFKDYISFTRNIFQLFTDLILLEVDCWTQKSMRIFYTCLFWDLRGETIS